MQAFRKPRREPDVLTLAVVTWLAGGIVLLGLTPLPLRDPRYGWSLTFWLVAAPLALLAALCALPAHESSRPWPHFSQKRCVRKPARAQVLAPARLRSIRRRNSCMMRR